MTQQKVFFAGNIKFLRERKKLTQEQMANELDISRSKLNALESGQTKAPQPEDYLNFSSFFKMSVDSLLKVDLKTISELSIRELEAGNDSYMTGSKLRVLAITTDKNNKENYEYIPVKAKAGYRIGHNDPDFLATLPSFTMPNLPKGKTFRMFPTAGDSMLPVPEGSDVIARFVEDWKSIKPRTACILILNGVNDFVFKLVTMEQDGQILLESLNRNYKPYTVRASEVLEVWQFHSYQATVFPEALTDLQSMAGSINEILAEIQVLKRKK